jgi:hypothetical protein
VYAVPVGLFIGLKEKDYLRLFWKIPVVVDSGKSIFKYKSLQNLSDF